MTTLKGVQFEPPPPNLRAAVDAAIATALDTSSVKPGELAMVSIGTNVGWNSAIVLKTASGFEASAFIGSRWGERIQYGAKVQKRWTLGGRRNVEKLDDSIGGSNYDY
jgi:hypothetical protein